MSKRRILLPSASLMIAVVSLLIAHSTRGSSRRAETAAPPAGYHVIRNILLGGEGNWDYLTVDPSARRLYIPRYSHVQVVDEISGKLIADVPDVPGAKGVAVAPEFHRGFVSGNDPDPTPAISVLDLRSLRVTGKLMPKESKHSDSFAYDAVSKRVFINTAESNDAQVIDASTAKIITTIRLPGRPEQMVADGTGKIFVNIVDKGEVAEYDAKTLRVEHVWSSGPCQHGYGIALDRAHRRLFVACQPSATSGVLVVMDADTGAVVASMPIGIGSDGAAFDPGTGDVFATCRDSGDGQQGATYVFHQESPDRYSQSAVVKTIYGARGVALDAQRHRVFTVATAENEPVPVTPENPHPRPKIVPKTFTLVEIGNM
jgi:DNA-binding beta-propeller fold protein YncE